MGVLTQQCYGQTRLLLRIRITVRLNGYIPYFHKAVMMRYTYWNRMLSNRWENGEWVENVNADERCDWKGNNNVRVYKNRTSKVGVALVVDEMRESG